MIHRHKNAAHGTMIHDQETSNFASIIATIMARVRTTQGRRRRGQDLTNTTTNALNVNDDMKSINEALPSCSSTLCCGGVSCDAAKLVLPPLPNHESSHILVRQDDYHKDTYNECLICWDCIKDTDGPQDCLPCGHVFHRGCINDWRYCNQSCPTCRIDLEFAEMHC